ncbi:MAG: hypothetical protein GC164_05270 [Phycisphaera sp.]|nr:hypothetical protein [Phycisphaera sp.]
MTISGFNVTRPTLLLSSDSLLNSLRKTQLELLQKQVQTQTGVRVGTPSDSPSTAPAILLLQRQLEARTQHEQNLQNASGILDNTDQALQSVSDALLEAKSIASSQVGIGSNSDTRRSEAAVIDGIIKGLIDTGNRQHAGVSIFGGNKSAGVGGTVFEDFLGGIRYTGGTQNLTALVGLREPLAVNANGVEAFGANTTRVKGTVDLDPQATNAVNLHDIDGALGEGFRNGAVKLTVDGNVVSVDLTTADTLGDVATRINDAINGVDPTAGAVSVGGDGFTLTANAGHTVAIDNFSLGSYTASDLGLVLSAASTSVAGGDVGVRLTMNTRLSDLGASVDLTSGIKITQGSISKVADFSSATTVQDMANILTALNMGMRLDVNSDGTGLNLVSEVSGVALSIGENAGGTTATDLGLRSLSGDTLLSDFNNGLGVHNVQGEDDFRIQLHDGTTFDVNIDNLTTVQQVIDAITASAESALGIGNVGAPGSAQPFNVGFKADGNGLYFEDNTAGASDFRVMQLGQSLTATDLGIYSNAGTGTSLTGTDNATVRSDGLFTHLIALRDALLSDDSRGITFAGDGIERSINEIARVRAGVGVRAQRVTQQQQRSQDLGLSEKSLLSDLRDTDLTEAITRFGQLQQQLQASLTLGAQAQQLNLLDFLR